MSKHSKILPLKMSNFDTHEILLLDEIMKIDNHGRLLSQLCSISRTTPKKKKKKILFSLDKWLLKR